MDDDAVVGDTGRDIVLYLGPGEGCGQFGRFCKRLVIMPGKPGKYVKIRRLIEYLVSLLMLFLSRFIRHALIETKQTKHLFSCGCSNFVHIYLSIPQGAFYKPTFF